MTKKKSPTQRKLRRRRFGTVNRRPGGPGWIAQFPDPSGRKLRNGRTAMLTRSVETKAEGEALLAEIEKAVRMGTLGVPEAKPEKTDLTVLEAIDGHVAAMRAAGRKESSIEMVGYSRKAMERNGIGKKRVADLTFADIEAYPSWRRENVWKTIQRPGQSPIAVRVKGATASGAVAAHVLTQWFAPVRLQ